jgi:hypothetical protein
MLTPLTAGSGYPRGDDGGDRVREPSAVLGFAKQRILERTSEVEGTPLAN